MLTSIKDFEVIRKLGDGSFSQVYQVLRRSDSLLYALKKVKMNALKFKEKENAVNEVKFVNHLFFLRVFCIIFVKGENFGLYR